jgi:enediyne biosynthesis protein E4
VTRRLPLLLLTAWAGLAGCREAEAPRPQTAEAEETTPPIRFTDVTTTAGLSFVHENGSSTERYLPETMGAGVAFFDFDGDDRPDLFFADGVAVTTAARGGGAKPAGRLYRNRGDGTFEDVTEGAGLGSAFLAMGTAVGDFDNDGRTDLFVSGVGAQRLYRNLGGGEFEDATASAGLTLAWQGDDVGFGSSAAFFDADLDGNLDLLVGRYVRWSPSTDVRCSPDGVHHTYCTPEVYRSAENVFYRNLGDGRFVEATRAAGLDQPAGKTLGLAVFDANRDGWPDVAVANDTDRNHLFLNRGDGTFDEVGLERGLALSVSGATRGAMGIDAGDLDGDGITDLAIGNFAQEMSAVYLGTSGGLFRDDAARLGVGLPSLMQVAFGTLLIDLDLDGRLDLVLANGHIEPEIAQYQSVQHYRQPLGVYRSTVQESNGESVLVQVKATTGPLAENWVGRGLAAADFDGDGDLDLALTQNGDSARLLRNDSSPAAPGPGRRTGPANWLRVRLVGTASNGSGFGALLTVVAGERRIESALDSGRSYLSAVEPIVTFGLGGLDSVDQLEVRWPSGVRQIVAAPALHQLLIVTEPHP